MRLLTDKYKTLGTIDANEHLRKRNARPARPDLPDRYHFLRFLGHGAQGEVYAAQDLLLDRQVAIKTIRGDKATPDQLQQFSREAELTSKLSHPNIVSVLDAGNLADGRVWYSMPLVWGDTLFKQIDTLDYVHGEGGWGTGESGDRLRGLLDVFVSICHAAQYAHGENVIHRDIKPHNILVGELSQTYLVDWGISAAAHQETPFGGTPAYMSPEQAEAQVPRASSDVYALGTTLFHILAGHPPRPWQVDRPYPLKQRLQDIELLADKKYGFVPIALRDALRYALNVNDYERNRAEYLGLLVRRWLDGVAARAATETVMESVGPVLVRSRERIDALRSQRAQSSERLWSQELSEQEREQLYGVLDRCDEELQDIEVRVNQGAAALRASMRRFEVPGANFMLSEYFVWAARYAELRQDHGALHRAISQLSEHDPDGNYAQLIGGQSRFTLLTQGPGVLRMFRVGRQGRVLSLVEDRCLRTPVEEEPIPSGQWLFELEQPGFATQRISALLMRGQCWQLGPPHEPQRQAAQAPELPKDQVLVPAGSFLAGGDPLAFQGIPEPALLWAERFVAARDPLSNGQWRAWLLESGCVQDGWAASWGFERQGLEQQSAEWAAEPVGGLPPSALQAYLAAHPSWRLPHELEWEKLARGAWGQPWPCGQDIEVVQRLPRRVVAPGEGAWERSVYGVRGLMTGRMELCSNGWLSELPRDGVVDPMDAGQGGARVARGGFAGASPGQCRGASRHRVDAGDAMVGVRLVRG